MTTTKKKLRKLTPAIVRRNQKLLIEALESGDYCQTTGSWAENGCHCAEGVVGCLAKEAGYSRYVYGHGRPFPAILRRFGLATNAMEVTTKPFLVPMNDADRLTFPQIAARLRMAWGFPKKGPVTNGTT